MSAVEDSKKTSDTPQNDLEEIKITETEERSPVEGESEKNVELNDGDNSKEHEKKGFFSFPKLFSRKEGDAESEIEKEERVLSVDDSAHMMFYAKLFGTLSLNFVFSMLVVYIMVTVNVFQYRKSYNIWLALGSIVVAVFSYGALYYTMQSTKKIVVPTQVFCLYLYIAAMSVLLVLISTQFVFLTAIIMYALVAVCFGLIVLFIFTLVSRFCVKPGSKMWATAATILGASLTLIYLAFVIFVAHKPAVLPPQVLEPLIEHGLVFDDSRYARWRRVTLFVASAILSVGFITFSVSYSMEYVRKHEDAAFEKSIWLRVLMHIYVYISLPLVALVKGVGALVNWIVKQAKKSADKTAEREVEEERASRRARKPSISYS